MHAGRLQAAAEPVNKRRALGRETRARIVAAARRLMAERGYAATSIAAISGAAGVQPASLYWAFGSKEGLFAAVLEETAARWFEESINPELLATEKGLWDVVRSLARPLDEQPEFLRLLLVLTLERRDGDPTVLATAREVRALARHGFAAAIERWVEGPARRRRAVALALGRLLVMLMDGAFVSRQIEPEANRDELFELMVTALRATLAELAPNGSARRASRRAKGVVRR
ncbi:MAG TPA: helix-turn-helix domain-containing protein [Candidatus Dormibacteraeota bacterium]|nr:helix-turn-helix domain-containing protein [Candidatus Dormibacteraeota bacterium]